MTTAALMSDEPQSGRRARLRRRLDTTGTVIGLFEDTDCEPGEVQLSPSDLLVIFSDGVTEALRGDDRFGEERLVDELCRDCSMPMRDIAGAVCDRVVEFSAGTQSDNLSWPASCLAQARSSQWPLRPPERSSRSRHSTPIARWRTLARRGTKFLPCVPVFRVEGESAWRLAAMSVSLSGL